MGQEPATASSPDADDTPLTRPCAADVLPEPGSASDRPPVLERPVELPNTTTESGGNVAHQDGWYFPAQVLCFQRWSRHTALHVADCTTPDDMIDLVEDAMDASPYEATCIEVYLNLMLSALCYFGFRG